MKIRYTSDYLGDSAEFCVGNTRISLNKYVWYKLSEQRTTELLKNYPTIFEDEENTIVDFSIEYTSPLNIAIIRTHAVGDILAFIPVINYLRKHTPHKYTLVTRECFVELVENFNVFHQVMPYLKYKKSEYERAIDLGHIMFPSFSTTHPDHLRHLVNIYTNELNIPPIEKADWSITLPNTVVKIKRPITKKKKIKNVNDK